MEDKPNTYPVLLQWDQGPEELKKLKNRLLLYFQSYSESHGGECDIPDTDCSQGYVTIYFKEQKAQQGVVQKSPHHLLLQGGSTLSLRVSLPDAENTQRRGSSSSSPAASSDYGASESLVIADLFGKVKNPSPGVHEMTIGSVTYQVKTGDITKEVTDVIVNSSNRDFTLRTGVSKAILEAAGPPIASSAAALGSKPHKGYVVTASGRLRKFIWIIHVKGPDDPKSIKKIVLDVLLECENLQVSSVAFPALGTGAGKLAASTVADSILDGLVDFIKSTSVCSLQTVKVVLFQPQMLNDFHMRMTKRKAKALFARITDAQTLPKHCDPSGGTPVTEVGLDSSVQQKFEDG